MRPAFEENRLPLLAPLLALGLLLAAAPAMAQAANPDWLRPGSVSLAVTTAAPSSIPLDVEALVPLVCAPTEPYVLPRWVGKSMGGGSEECRLVVGNGGNGGTLPDGGPPTDLRLQVLQIVADRGGCGMLVEVRPAGLTLWGEERVDLGCGSKPFSLGLAGHGGQPTSWLHLLAGDPQAPTGWFVGSLAIAAEVRIDGTGLESPPRMPLPLNLELSGRWTALDAGSMPSLPAGQSTLVLLVEKVEGEWRGKISCGQDRSRCGRLCLEAAGSASSWLNGDGAIDE